MQCCTILLKPHLLKVFTNDHVDCKDDLIFQHVFIFLGYQVAFNKEWSYQSVIRYSSKCSISVDIAYCVPASNEGPYLIIICNYVC